MSNTKKTTKNSSASSTKATKSTNSNAKWIKGFEGQYKITESGTVISFKKSEKGTPLKPRKNTSGYLCVDLRTEGSHNERYIHKLVAQHFIRNTKPKTLNQVRFKDGNRQNVKAKNLVWSNRTISNEIAKQKNSKKTNVKSTVKSKAVNSKKTSIKSKSKTTRRGR